MDFLWATDTHLDHILYDDGVAKDDRFDEFVSAVNKENADVLLITGDISNAKGLKNHMQLLEQRLNCKKILFILGNHDYYHGSISSVRSMVKEQLVSDKLVYLSSIGSVPLDDNTCVVGHDGWYDGKYGDWFKPGVVLMNDYLIISELRSLWFSSDQNRKKKLYEKLQGLAKECEFHIMQHLAKAAETYKNVVFATHVPPFKENSVYNGAISDSNWLPNFSSKICGDALLQVANKYPNTEFLVLCGHSHGKATYSPCRNLTSCTGFSEYGHPELSLQRIRAA
jgi:predicted phosphohydrolase